MRTDIPIHVWCGNFNVIAFNFIFVQSVDITVYKLKEDTDEAATRLMFLLDYAILPCKYMCLVISILILLYSVYVLDNFYD